MSAPAVSLCRSISVPVMMICQAVIECFSISVEWSKNRFRSKLLMGFFESNIPEGGHWCCAVLQKFDSLVIVAGQFQFEAVRGISGQIIHHRLVGAIHDGRIVARDNAKMDDRFFLCC